MHTHSAAIIALFIGAWAVPGIAHAQGAHDSQRAGITSETMHKLYGGGILALSTTLLLEENGAFDAPGLRYTVPGLVMAAGGLLAIDPILHGSAAPSGYEAETRQHLLLGGVLAAVGAVDFAREAGWLDHWSWGLVLPAGLLATSASFFFHAQHGDPAQHDLLTVQHRMLGATLAVAAITKALAAPRASRSNGPRRWPALQSAWMIATAIAGLQLLLYSEGSAAPASSTTHEHALSVGWTGRGIALSGSF